MSIQRDYKPASAWQHRRRAVRRHGLLVITLILIGLFGGLLAYIKGDRHQQAPATAAQPVAPTQPTRAPAPPTTPKVVAPEPAPAPIKPKYDFYTELPKRQVDIQQEEINPRATPPSQPPPRTQPANEPLRKPAAPQKNPTTPTVAALSAGGAKSMTRSDSADPLHGVRSAQPLANRPGIAVKP
ncbi:MAG: hypothetical protein RKP20_01210 [Candidatus Competibacter sp.]|nr:hypothetical protein [Candidatus Competibacter sp.]